jgi:hypothetical protein
MLISGSEEGAVRDLKNPVGQCRVLQDNANQFPSVRVLLGQGLQQLGENQRLTWQLFQFARAYSAFQLGDNGACALVGFLQLVWLHVQEPGE